MSIDPTTVGDVPTGPTLPWEHPGELPAVTATTSKDMGTISPPSRVLKGSAPPPELALLNSALLQRRLRAAALFFTAATAAILAWDLLFFRDPYWPFHATMFALSAAGLIYLLRQTQFSAVELHVLEWWVFGIPAVFVALRHFARLHWYATYPNQEDWLRVSLRAALANIMLVVFAYCMLVPNRWQRAARVVLLFCSLPLLAEAALAVIYPDDFKEFREALNFEQVSETFVTGSIAACLAIYGASVINALRREAFEARQLNQYRLRQKLGGGGMGEVYLAEHQLLKRPCAVKLIRSDRVADPRALARFEREVQASAALTHPNTIEIYDYGRTEDGTFFYVMEYLRGASLDELVERTGAMPPERVVYLLRQVCGALREAHAAGLIHRDIKPANLFAAQRGGLFDFVKVLDFGLVKVAEQAEDERLSREGAILGSPLYMSPEQASGRNTNDPRSDIYSLGIVAYTLLTGRSPYEGLGFTEVLVAVVRDPVPPPTKLRADVPADLEAVVLRCLRKKPEQRYADVNELDQALAACGCAGGWNRQRAVDWWRAFERPNETPKPKLEGAVTTQFETKAGATDAV